MNILNDSINLLLSVSDGITHTIGNAVNSNNTGTKILLNFILIILMLGIASIILDEYERRKILKAEEECKKYKPSDEIIKIYYDPDLSYIEKEHAELEMKKYLDCLKKYKKN